MPLSIFIIYAIIYLVRVWKGINMEIALAISILSAVMTVVNFVVNRKDKAVKDTKENHQDLIEYQLKELKEDVKTILSKLDKYDKEVKDSITEALELHVKLYHGGEEK